MKICDKLSGHTKFSIAKTGVISMMPYYSKEKARSGGVQRQHGLGTEGYK